MKITYVPTSYETKLFDKFGYTYEKVIFDFWQSKRLYLFKQIEKCKTIVEIKGQLCGDSPDPNYIKIPQNVTKINNLGNVIEIGDSIFGDNLISVTMPTTLTQIGEHIFERCKSLKNVDYCGKTVLTNLVSIDKMTLLKHLKMTCTYVEVPLDKLELFQNIPNVLLKVKSPNKILHLHTICLPVNVCALEYTFQYQLTLKEITLPQSLTSIDYYCFSGCISLENVKLSDYLKIIGVHAFSACGLTNIDIPNNVTSVGDYAFANCLKLKSVIFPESVLEGRDVFFNCRTLSSVQVIKTGRVNINWKCTFSNCCLPKEFEMPNCVTSIGNKAFEQCSLLSKIILGNCVEYFKDLCFANCVNLEEFLCQKQ
ncbi:hypothetical protein EIN_270390 [Entamoeba invadens IP1]|uniref:Leucine rich repeat containing protein BspA family protein n=1 Tax=Entamoeba invadens IP1 TaxID=370355 RepID=A0A0A1U8C0_ENTIV|nr:hypothetical protein EIN_270390 [Entamoeba invadens IP1]ELP91143.1 hypothetical protein EIN_270390 [Entamoeba invadens IP1]|eukprot:XP_004257914.1 hypothetical protein EIN_270390 [Entamoeba invadens IP1]